MTLKSPPPDVEEELAPIRKAIDALRASAASYRRPDVLDPSNAAVLAVAEAHAQAMKDLAPLGFNTLGDGGDRLKDGSHSVSRWFGHSDGTICGWLAFIKPKTGPRLVVFLATEASGPAYCTTIRGGSRLSLARPPNVSHADHDMSVSLADTVRDHRERNSALTTAGMRLTNVATIEQAISVVERLTQNRAEWRGSSDENELLRADFVSVLAHQSVGMAAEDFMLMYSRAAEWLDFHPTHATIGEHVDLASGPLADLLTSTLTGSEAETGTSGVESDWLFHSEFKLHGKRLQMLDVFMAGNDDEGVILDASTGVYVVEARVVTYGIDRRISHVRVHPKGQVVTVGARAGEVGVDLAAVAICDVDRLAGWANDHQDEWQRWGDKLWFHRTAHAGIYTCEPAKTVVPFVDSGFGDGTYPVYYLMRDGRPVGLEAEFIPPGTPYV